MHLVDGSAGVFFWDQEPFNLGLFSQFSSDPQFFIKPKLLIIANSDICTDIPNISLYNWNYFFHGFAALDWFNDLYYLNDTHQNFDKVFITVNRLVTQERSYRLALTANLLDSGLDEYGLISCPLQDNMGGSWKNEIFNKTSCLSTLQKKQILKVFSKLENNLTLDFDEVKGYASAIIDQPQRDLFQRAFLHIVTETVFYSSKIHLTEKIFRPIVFKRPFVLAGAAGNLKYLKKYGFETFNNWWDESYDDEIDDELRLNMITKIVQKLSTYTMDDLKDMYNEMLPILNYNYNHFYGKFKEIIVEELLDNYRNALDTWNSNNDKKYNYEKVIDFKLTKQILSS